MGNKIIALTALFIVAVSLAGVQASGSLVCTEDCPDPIWGYKLIGCTHVVDYAVENETGVHVPAGSDSGYVYLLSSTGNDENGDEYSETIACDYWKENMNLPEDSADPETDLLLEAVETYNQNLDTLPDFVHSLLGDEIMHVYATMPDGREKEYAAITEGGMIVEGGNWVDFDNDGNYDIWKAEGIEPTLELHIDEEGNITYEGLNVGTMAKEFFIDIGMMLYDLFS
jgi:hypothetical protein